MTLLVNSEALHAQTPGLGLGTRSTMELLMNVGECSRSKHMLHPPSFIEKSLLKVNEPL